MKEFLIENVKKLRPSGIRKVNEKTLLMEEAGEDVLHFEIGRPDFDTPEYIKKSAIKALEEGDVFYTSNYGKMELREEVAKKLKRENNIDAKAENILITAGASESLLDVYETFLEEGDEILIPDPCWPNYINATYLRGAKPVRYSIKEENDFQIDFDELEKLVSDKTKLMLIITPSNPIGSVLNDDTIKKVKDFAEKHDILVIADEIYERIVFDGERQLSLASLEGAFDRTITLNGYSKTYSMTGWRLAYICAKKEYIDILNRVHQHNTSCATSFVQTAGIVALRDEKDEVEKMVAEYEKRRDYLVEKVNSIEGLSIKKPGGAFYAFISIKDLGVDSQTFCDYLLDEAKVATVPGSEFGDEGNGYIRFSYANSYENIVEGLNRIEKAVEKFKNR